MVEDYKKELNSEISKVNSKGKIPTIEKSSKTSANFCTNGDIQNFVNNFEYKSFGESSDNNEEKDKSEEKACKKFKSEDERCITCYVKGYYGTNCILIHSYAIYEDFKKLIGHTINGITFEFTYAYCQDVNIKFYYYYYIILIILFI